MKRKLGAGKKVGKSAKRQRPGVTVAIRVFIGDRNRQAFSISRAIESTLDYADLMQELRKKLRLELESRGILPKEAPAINPLPRRKAAYHLLGFRGDEEWGEEYGPAG
ncbi:MAG: hypothetical protein QXG35_00585 [Nitrososphaerota archaeon]